MLLRLEHLVGGGTQATAHQVCRHFSCQPFKETSMQWTTPAFTDLRFGFEITMYIANR